MQTTDLETLRQRWQQLVSSMEAQYGDTPDLQVMLFLIGVQELGKGPGKFSKEEKQDLMHLGTCRILSPSGYYNYKGTDADGWPDYELVKKLPAMSLRDQDILLKQAVVDYFDSNDLTGSQQSG